MKKILKFAVVAAIVATLLFVFVCAGPNYNDDYDYDDDDDGFFEMLSKIIDDIKHLPRTIADMVGSAISALMEFVVKEYLAAVLNLVTAMIKSLENLLSDATLDINHPVVKAIFDILRPTSSTLAVLFLIIQITKSAATFEAIDITRTTKYLLFFVLSIFIIDNSLNILTLIIQGFGSLTRRVLALGYGTGGVSYLGDIFSTSFSLTSVGDSIGGCLLATILAILSFFMVVSIYITLTIRSIEILILAATSGLFSSTLASDATADVYKSFIKTFIATVSSTLFMSIAFALFTSIANIQFFTGGFAYVDSVIKLTAIMSYCIRTPQTIRSILGTGSPAVNALSVVKSLIPH